MIPVNFSKCAKSLCLLFVFVLLLNFTLYSQTNILHYNPNSAGLALGKNFDIFNPSVAYANNVISSYKMKPSNHVTKEVNYYFLSSQSSSMSSNSVNISAETSFLGFFSAEGSYNSSESSMYNEKDLTICLMGVTDYGNQTIETQTIAAGVDDLANRPEDFKQKYGEFYVSAVHRKAIIYIYLTIKNVEISTKSQIMTSLGGSIGIAPFSASVHMDLNKSLQSYINKRAVAITVKCFGNNSLRDIPVKDICSDFYSTDDFGGNCFNSIMKYMSSSTFSLENASDVEYFYSPLSQFGYRDDDYFNKIDHKLTKYIHLCSEWYNAVMLGNRIDEIFGFPAYGIHSKADEVFLNNAKDSVEHYIDEMVDQMSICRNSNCATMSTCCNSTVTLHVDDDKLHTLYDRFKCPLHTLNCVTLGDQLTNFTSPQINVFNKTESTFKNLVIPTSATTKYKICSNIKFQNFFPHNASFKVVWYINGVAVETQTLNADKGSTIYFFWYSNPYDVNTKFAGKLPESVEVKIFSDLYDPFPNTPGHNPLPINILSGSNLYFEFIR